MIYNAGGVAISGYNIATGQAGIGDYLNMLPALGAILGRLRQACFTEGTQVVVGYDAQGGAVTRNIEDLREGDWVLAKDENNPDGEPVLKQVTKVWIKTVTQLRVLTLTNDDGDEQVIETTDEHPFFVEGRGWIGAGELSAGDRVLTATGVSTVAATFVVQHPQGITVYNLEVEGAHTFFVDDVAGGVDAAWVHNASYLNHRVGRFAEGQAISYLKGRGYSEFLVIRNASNHGVDILAKKGHRWVAFEVKGSSGSIAPALSAAQARGPSWYVNDRMLRAAGRHPNPTKNWNMGARERARANEILKQIADDGGIRGVVIELTDVFTYGPMNLAVRIWR